MMTAASVIAENRKKLIDIISIMIFKTKHGKSWKTQMTSSVMRIKADRMSILFPYKSVLVIVKDIAVLFY